jgi:hypothetical protein
MTNRSLYEFIMTLQGGRAAAYRWGLHHIATPAIRDVVPGKLDSHALAARAKANGGKAMLKTVSGGTLT